MNGQDVLEPTEEIIIPQFLNKIKVRQYPEIWLS